MTNSLMLKIAAAIVGLGVVGGAAYYATTQRTSPSADRAESGAEAQDAVYSIPLLVEGPAQPK